MKKLLLLFLLIPLSLLAYDYDEIWIVFKSGGIVDFTAESTWTRFYHKHNHYCFLDNARSKEIKDDNYLCIWDYCCINPSSNTTERGDFKHLRDAIQATGNEVNYFEDDGIMIDDWCVSIRYDQIDKVEIYRSTSGVDGGTKTVYVEPDKYE